jgi:RimJ/RimL family protein N-acetyltransferase
LKSAPERVETRRLVLRRPVPEDAESILARYAGDAEVTRYLSFARHRSLSDTHAFLKWSDAEWARWPGGPYLVESRGSGELLGSTGFGFETPQRASTGYVFARETWGHGFATEALQAVVAVAQEMALRRLYALCHVDHLVSAHVLEKCGFAREGLLRRNSLFPNLEPRELHDVFCYARVIE